VLPALGAKISKIRGLDEELAAALDAPKCRVSRQGAAISIELPRDDPETVQLLPLFRQLICTGEKRLIPPMTAVLGLAEDGAPLMIRLPSPDVAHILVAGTTGSGKTVLLQTMLLSLAMTNAPGALSAVLIDPKGSAFAPFGPLPHLARPVIQDPAEALEALGSLVHLMEKRSIAPGAPRVPWKGTETGDRSGDEPRIALVIDELADLLMVGGPTLQHALTRLTQRGREAGIHVVAATQKPTAALLGSLVKANFPVRLVGRVTSIEDARTATGWGSTGAERLLGRGDFLAIAEGRMLRFQVAHIGPTELGQVALRLACGEPPLPVPSDGRQQTAMLQPVRSLARLFSGRE
jgi:S-DNA-T family DNA segregation ATPase FtsK/SpoIIIE